MHFCRAGTSDLFERFLCIAMRKRHTMAFLRDTHFSSRNIYGNARVPAKEWSRESLTLAVFDACVAFWGLVFIIIEALSLKA